MSHWNPDHLARAWALAARRHQGQTYGGQAEGERVEYVTHIGSVVMELCWALPSEAAANADLAVLCAVLHDTIEDTGTTREEIRAEFGEAVAAGVQALSKDASLVGKRAQMEDSLRRIQLQPREIWMVKMADRIANLYAPPFYWNNDKMRAYQEEARVILDALGSASGALASRLAAKITAYEGFLRP